MAYTVHVWSALTGLAYWLLKKKTEVGRGICWEDTGATRTGNGAQIWSIVYLHAIMKNKDFLKKIGYLGFFLSQQ